MVERLQRQLLRAQCEPAHGIEARRVGDARLAARPVAVELQQHVGVELGGDLFGVERMAQEFPDAGPQRGVMLGRRRSLGGDQEERGARAHVVVVAQGTRRGERVHVGERLVEHYEIGWRGVRLLECLGAAMRAAHGVAAPLGELQQLRAGAMIMTRDEQLGGTRAGRRHVNILVSCGRPASEGRHGRRRSGATSGAGSREQGAGRRTVSTAPRSPLPAPFLLTRSRSADPMRPAIPSPIR